MPPKSDDAAPAAGVSQRVEYFPIDPRVSGRDKAGSYPGTSYGAQKPFERTKWLFALGVNTAGDNPIPLLLVGASYAANGDIRWSRLDLAALEQGKDIVGPAHFEAAIVKAVHRDLIAQGVSQADLDPFGATIDVA